MSPTATHSNNFKPLHIWCWKMSPSHPKNSTLTKNLTKGLSIDGTKIEGVKNVRDAYKYKATKFDMGDDDYLKEFSGYLNSAETAIDCLVFKSFLGETRKVGKSSPTSKSFKFDISSRLTL